MDDKVAEVMEAVARIEANQQSLRKFLNIAITVILGLTLWFLTDYSGVHKDHIVFATADQALGSRLDSLKAQMDVLTAQNDKIEQALAEHDKHSKKQ